MVSQGMIAHSLPNKPAFIALPCTATIRSNLLTDMLTVANYFTPLQKQKFGLKWQASEIPALAELLKALAT